MCLYTDSEESAHTHTHRVLPKTQILPFIVWIKPHSNLSRVYDCKTELKFTFQSVNKYVSLQINKIESKTYEKWSDEAEQRTLSLPLLIETRVQMFSTECLFAVLLFRSWVTICFLSLYDTALGLHESFGVFF